ncbi:MAG TPA: hypothetical protein VJJ52_04255 [Candidatus Nanoarchaeia archaeon]|nr:hypothetical protein [Candidatus Nanoarchaeia archaeon]
MKKELVVRLGSVFFVLLLFSTSVYAAGALINPNGTGFDDKSNSQNYDGLVDAIFNGKTVQTIDNMMWVPWYRTSSGCAESDLIKAPACNSPIIDSTHNCMVTDEFSQVGILVSMGNNQKRMDEFYSIVINISCGKYGKLPGWRYRRNGDIIDGCGISGVNGNSDSASDASARITSSLWQAAVNPYFSSEARGKYKALAKQLTDDMINYEIDQKCRPTQKYGQVCYWLAGGSHVKSLGLENTPNNYAFTGYFGDVIITMLQACKQTGDQKYCEVARNLGLNYLHAAQFDGLKFTVPPGKAFSYVMENGTPMPRMTEGGINGLWDGFDATRATTICTANYYAKSIKFEMPELDNYCRIWGEKYMGDIKKVPTQYYQNGTALNYQSGYYAQGLQAEFLMGYDSSLLQQALDNSIKKHYNPSTKVWDNENCYGIYTKAFAVRALGIGIGRDLTISDKNMSAIVSYNLIPIPNLVNNSNLTINQEIVIGHNNTNKIINSNTTPDINFYSTEKNLTSNKINLTNSNLQIKSLSTKKRISEFESNCIVNGKECKIKSDTTKGVCRTLIYKTTSENIQVQACEKDNGHVEVYRQKAPTGVIFSACIAKGCVNNIYGFARFLAN